MNDQFREICDKVLEAKAKTPAPWIAAFDADGTLWNTDLGELFFNYQIRSSGLTLPADPWDHYLSTKKVDTPKAYLWLAQINAKQKIETVRRWAEEAFIMATPFPFFSFQKRLIEFLHKEKFEVYVVTASVKWAVEPGARRLDIPESHVLGVTTKVQDGIVTDIQDGLITWKEGKAKTLLQHTRGVRPLLAAGNTTGDTALLETATALQIAVLSQKTNGHLHSLEMELQKLAQSKGWITLDLS